MTICQALRFSVLSAPVAAADRRSLSQAWYSALYRTADPRRSIESQNIVAPPRSARGNLAVARERFVQSARLAGPSRPRAGASQRTNAILERRAALTPLARKIVELAKQPLQPRTSATFDLGSAIGRVRVLVRTGRDGTHVIAICTSRIRPQVAAALAQVRYALAPARVLIQTTANDLC